MGPFGYRERNNREGTVINLFSSRKKHRDYGDG